LPENEIHSDAFMFYNATLYDPWQTGMKHRAS
jgi:hypothetical protein